MRTAAPPEPDPGETLVESPLSPFASRALMLVAAFYLCAIMSDALGLRWLDLVPRPLRYLTQVSRLFPSAAEYVIDYRAEGFFCADGTFRELDLSAYFPIDRGIKENRFYRTLQFYRQHRATLRALDDYIVERYDADVARARSRGDKASMLGGVRFLSLRIPLGDINLPVARYERKPLSDYPASTRKRWYVTPSYRRRERCAKFEGTRDAGENEREEETPETRSKEREPEHESPE